MTRKERKETVNSTIVLLKSDGTSTILRFARGDRIIIAVSKKADQNIRKRTSNAFHASKYSPTFTSTFNSATPNTALWLSTHLNILLTCFVLFSNLPSRQSVLDKHCILVAQSLAATIVASTPGNNHQNVRHRYRLQPAKQQAAAALGC